MLEESIAAQLREVLGGLQSKFTLVLAPSSSEKQSELLDLARGLATTSPRIETAVVGETRTDVLMALHKDGVPTGVSFRGVPGGHEFTSLVLAILNADGQG
jgi:alkyl hydroperoxide reductase subunit F